MGPFACLPKENEASHIKRVVIIFWPFFFLYDTLYCLLVLTISDRRLARSVVRTEWAIQGPWRKYETEWRRRERERGGEVKVTLETLYFLCQLGPSSPLLWLSNSVGPIKTGNNLTRSPCDVVAINGRTYWLSVCPASYYHWRVRTFSTELPRDDGSVAAVINNTPGIISTLNCSKVLWERDVLSGHVVTEGRQPW